MFWFSIRETLVNTTVVSKCDAFGLKFSSLLVMLDLRNFSRSSPEYLMIYE